MHLGGAFLDCTFKVHCSVTHQFGAQLGAERL
jgi:hypothetical protein